MSSSSSSSNHHGAVDPSSWWRSASQLVSQHPHTVLWGGLALYVAVGVTLQGKARRAYFRPITLITSGVMTVVGFVVNVADDATDAWRDGRTAVWQQAMQALAQFLRQSGLEADFDATLSSSSLLPSLLVLTDLQNKLQTQRRQNLRLPDAQVDPADLQQGQRYMRYATAVYGPEMMASTQLAVQDDIWGSPTDSNHDLIARHVRLIAPTETIQNTTRAPSPSSAEFDIWCDYTRDPTTADVSHAQHALVVCTHAPVREIVLTIRGTFSVSGLITDLAGYCTDFGGGAAHAGMAAAAQETWDTLWADVLQPGMAKLPRQGDDYALVVTGHSLGAGVACLVTILVYHLIEKGKLPAAWKRRRIECYAMAPPPVFSPPTAAPQAVANTLAYVNQYDCVPSLSVDAIRRLMACLDALQAVLAQHPMWELAAKRWELGEPQPALRAAYERASSTALRPLERAPLLVVPARQLIWLEKQKDKDDTVVGYQAHALDPTKYAARVFDLEVPDCVADHMTPEYEMGFAWVLGDKDINEEDGEK